MFKGPLFIVGMPRSGTKLLRDLLNQHPKINIPEVETHFLPFFIKKFGLNASFDVTLKTQLFDAFYDTSFYWNISNSDKKGKPEFEKRKEQVNNWNDFVYLVFNCFGPKGYQEEVIHGDKTPGYINHIPLLKSICPDAKFIHIIRDPRDYCLSVKNIWNKNMYRAAATWTDTMESIDKQALSGTDYYTEIAYEALINDVEGSMKSLVSFIGIPFDPGMTQLTKTAENYGDAKVSGHPEPSCGRADVPRIICLAPSL